MKTMGRGEDVAITGFGTFRVAKRAAREGRNPKTGEKIQIKLPSSQSSALESPQGSGSLVSKFTRVSLPDSPMPA